MNLGLLLALAALDPMGLALGSRGYISSSQDPS